MARTMVEKLISILENTLAKLSRYDEGSFFSSILSLTVRRKFQDVVEFVFVNDGIYNIKKVFVTD